MGQRLVSFLGTEYIAAFIDTDSFLQSIGNIQGIPIISFLEYKRRYHQYVLVLTPSGGMSDYIEKMLVEADEYGYLRMDECPNLFFEYDIDMLRNKWLQIYQPCMAFDRLNIVTILLNKWIEDKLQRKIRMIYPYGFLKKRIERISQLMPELELLKREEIHGRKIVSTSDDTRFEAKIRECPNEELLFEKIFSECRIMHCDSKLEMFKNIHKGERCFLVATGPSLKISDLDVLHQNNEISISVNSIYKSFNATKWRPTYYVASDTKMIYYNINDIMNMDDSIVFLSDNNLLRKLKIDKDGVYYFHTYFEKQIQSFSDDITKGMYSALNVMYYTMQIALYMGFSNIYIIGMDFSNLVSVPGKAAEHFSDAYDDERLLEETYKLNLNEDKIKECNLLGYIIAKHHAEERGVKIYNATRGGNLEVFERVNFDTLFDEKN